MAIATKLLKKKSSGGVSGTYGIDFDGTNQYLTIGAPAAIFTPTANNYIKFKLEKPSGGNQTIFSGPYVRTTTIRDWTWLSIQNGTLTYRGRNSTLVPVNQSVGPAGLFSAAGTYDVTLTWPTTQNYELTVNGTLYTGSITTGYVLDTQLVAAKSVGDNSSPTEFNAFIIRELSFIDSTSAEHQWINTTGVGTFWEDVLSGRNLELINGPVWVPNP